MIKGIDHIVILVHDLAAASEDFRTLGFTVTPGGEHTEGLSHNALVPFSDGTYLELIAFKGDAQGHRWWGHAGSEGLIDFALLPDDAASVIAQARNAGVEYSGPAPGGRLRPDGQQVQWQTGTPAEAGLPFLCGDVTSRELRVPGGAAQQHANGATGINGLTILVPDVAAAAARYSGLLGVPVPPAAYIAPLGLRIATFELGSATIGLAEPERAGSELHSYVAEHGPGMYAMTLSTSTAAPTGWPDPALAHGVRMELDND